MVVGKKKAKRLAKKAARTGSRKQRKQHSKALSAFNVERRVASMREVMGIADVRDRGVLRAAESRIEQKKKQNLERRAIKGLNVPDDVKRNILSFIGPRSNVAIRPIPKRK